MTKKRKKTQKLPRELTKRQLSHWQQQKRRQRIILSAGIFVIATVIVIVLVGWYAGQYRPMHQTIIRVNDTEFNMKYYVEMLKLRGGGQSDQYLQQIGDTIVNDIEQYELIRQEALKRGISVSDKEVRETLKSSDLPNTDVYQDLTRNQMLIEKLLDEYFEQEVPVSAEQAHIIAMLLESESQAAEVRARLENGESFKELAGELSVEYLTKNEEGDLDWHPENILTEMLGTLIPAEYASGAEVGTLSKPIYDAEITKGVGYWLIKVLDRREEEEEAHVHAMLLNSEEEAREVRARLEAGENFATLAQELSQLFDAEENEGNLEWVLEGSTTPVFDEFVFNVEIDPGTLSEPIRDETVGTSGGYWLIKVADKDNDRPLEESDRDSLKYKALDEWITSLWDDPDNEIEDNLLDTERKAWAITQVKGR